MFISLSMLCNICHAADQHSAYKMAKRQMSCHNNYFINMRLYQARLAKRDDWRCYGVGTTFFNNNHEIRTFGVGLG